MPHDGATQGPRGWPNILGLLRGTTLRVTGKAGATAGAGLAGGTLAGAPTAPAGPFDVGDVLVSQSDGALWVCTAAGTSQSSPGTFTQVVAGSLASTLSPGAGGTGLAAAPTDGQLLIGQSSDHTFGLAALTAGSGIAVTNAGHGVTIAASGSGGGGTALTQLAQTILGAAAATIDFSSISGTFSTLKLTIVGRSTASTVVTALNMRLNADSASNYDYSSIEGDNGTQTGEVAHGAAQLQIGYVTGASDTSGNVGAAEVTIHDYARTQWRKAATSTCFAETTDGGHTYAFVFTGKWRSTAAVTEVTLSLGSGNFAAGSIATLYGVS